jgi:hypothetical protein
MHLQVFFTPLSQALRLIVHLGEPLPEERLDNYGFSFGTLFLFFLSSYGLMIWTNGVGASTGMFVPALAVGATGDSLPLLPSTMFVACNSPKKLYQVVWLCYL